MINAILKDKSKIVFNPQSLIFNGKNKKFKINYELDPHIHPKNPSNIKILLGDACNFRCKYCRQFIHDTKEKITTNKLDNFIENLKKNLDLSNLNKVEYWGGEPLLYWDEIQYLKKFFDTINKKCIHHLTTNGSLLNKAIYNELISGPNYMIKISHDGPGQEFRSNDPIKLHPAFIHGLYENLGPRNLFFINSVLTWKYLSPGKIVDYFRNEFDTNIQIMKIEPCIPYNIHSKFYSLKTQHFKEYTENFYNDLLTCDLLSNVQEYRELFKFFITASETSEDHHYNYNFAEGKCHYTQKQTITVDLDGNLMPCQVYNKNDCKIGELKNFKDINEELPLMVDRYRLCYDCPVISLCRGTCPYMQNLETISINCNVRFQTYLTLLKYFCKITYGFDIDHFEGKFYHEADQIY